MLEAFACFFLVALPLAYAGGPNGVREFLSIAGASLFWTVSAWQYCWGYGVVPNISLPVLLFGAWICLSILWSSHKDHSILDCLMLLSCLTAFHVVGQIDRELALFLCFAPAAGIASTMLWEEVRYRKMLASLTLTGADYDGMASYKRPGGIFGNCNHAGVYLALNVLTGAWLAQNVTMWILPFVLMVTAAIFFSRCRNAQAATLIGIASTFFFMKMWMVFLFLLAVGGVAMLFIHNKALSDRDKIFHKAIDLIRKKPLYGWGLNTFRIEQTRRHPYVATHRVHNDYLEFAYDIGLVGLLLLGCVYWMADWSASPLLSAQLLIGLGTAFWFFTFREIHTAMPVWGLLAVLVPPSTGSAVVPLICLAVLALPCILWAHIGKRIAGLYWWVKASRQKTKEAQYAYCLKAIGYEQNSQYLTRCAHLAAINGEQNMAWDLCARALYQFDGITTLVSLYAQTAKAAMLRGAFNLAVFYNQMSLSLCRDFPPSVEFKAELDRIQANLDQRRKDHVALQVR